MALVVFLKGVNVGGHRRFRPTVLARELKRFDVTNIGAAGTFVVRKPPGRETLRQEIGRRLPFDAEVMICDGDDILKLTSDDPFARHPPDPKLVQFVSVMARRRKMQFAVPLDLPGTGRWCVRVLDCSPHFVLGIHRREMRAIRFLTELEKVVGTSLATRSWSTVSKVAERLGQ